MQTPHTTESPRHHARSVAPPVDSHETREGLVVLAEVPGVAHAALEVRVDEHVRTMREQVHHTVPGDVISREYKLVNVFRQCSRHGNGDHSRSTAEVPCGVCTVQVRTAEEVTPRQNEVSVGEVLAHRGFFERWGGLDVPRLRVDQLRPISLLLFSYK
jgi:HSP20 family molecular chaperone IbpA